MIGWLFVPGTLCCGEEQFPQMTRAKAAQYYAEEGAERRAREEERAVQKQKEHDLLAARDRVSVYETHCVDELIDPTRPW